MIKMLTASTAEIDDVEKAVAELLEQLDIERNLCANAAGILTCYPEYVDTGVTEAICERLPFHVIGCSSPGNGMGGEAGTMLLCLSVLTGDDVFFATAQSARINADNMEGIVADAYRTAREALPEEPKLMIPFIPHMTVVHSEMIFRALDVASVNVPIFGTVAVDESNDGLPCGVLYDGRMIGDALSMVLIAGNVEPAFFRVAISDDRVQQQRGLVTESDGFVVRRINDMSTIDYLQSLGLSRGAGLDGIRAIPFMVDYGDGTGLVARAIWSVTEKGAYTAAMIPQGATIALGSMDYSNVLETTERSIEAVHAQKDKRGVLMFPCVASEYTMGADAAAELSRIVECVDGQFAYHACYSGGELCPMYNHMGEMTNRIHNYTFIACVL